MEDIRIGRRKRTREVKVFPSNTPVIIDNGPNTVHLYFPSSSFGGIGIIPAEGYNVTNSLLPNSGFTPIHLDIEDVGDLVTRRLKLFTDGAWILADPNAYYLYYVTELDEE